MMKTMKRFAALVLALSLLIGMPMSVSAIGTATPSDLKLIGAQAMPYQKIAPNDPVHDNANWKDRGVLFYFSQNLAKLADGGAGTDGGVKGRLLVVDDNNKLVSIDHDGNTHYLFWNLADYSKTPGNGKIVAHGGRLYDKTYTNTDKTTTAYTGTWTAIINLLATHEQLAGKGYRLQVRLYDMSTGADGFINQVKSANDSSIKLTATGTDTNGIGLADTNYLNKRYVAIDLGTVAAGATEITQTGMLTLDRVKMINDTHMELTYSESVEARMSDGVSVQVQVVSADATEVIQTFAATGISATSVKLGTNLTWADVQAVLDANEGSYARLRIQEKLKVNDSEAAANARDEWANNYAVDTIWGKTSQRPLQSDLMRNPGTVDGEARDFVYCKIEPFYFELLSATAINSYQVELKFSEDLRTEIHTGSGLPWIVNQLNANKNQIGVALVSDEKSASTGYYDVQKSSQIKGTVALGSDNKTLVWTADAPIGTLSEDWAKEGYSVKFYLYEDSCGWAMANNDGHVIIVQNQDKEPLWIPNDYARSDANNKEYMFMDIATASTSTLALVSAKQVGRYQIELKFTEDLRTDDKNGSAWILDTINNSTNVAIGMTWVKDGYTGQESFSAVTADAIEGTVELGETNDTLIWTVTNQIPANFISNLLKETKEGYTRKFYLSDNGCAWHGAGYIGGIQAGDATNQKPLSIPANYKNSSGAGAGEYLFMDITPISNPALEVVSVTEIGDYTLELQFSEALHDEVVDNISNSKNIRAGIAWMDNTFDGTVHFDNVHTDELLGTAIFGDTKDTLIWTLKNQNKTIAELMKETKSGYTRKFFFFDAGCTDFGANHIGGIKNADKTEALYTWVSRGAQECLFVDIKTYADCDQSEVINLENGDYHFMNADTGRSLVVEGTEEFTIVRKDGSNVIWLMVDEQYVNLHTSPATLGDTAYNYLLEACEYDRYRLLITPNVALSDGDTGADNTASLAPVYAGIDPISTGWYLTASGDAKPLRILPIGDSITYGSNPDGYVHGWRNELSASLADDGLDRFVFVGSQTSKTSSVDDAELYRHEGNPGWVASHIEGDSANKDDLASIATDVVNKYDPDVVLLMVGINDMGGYNRAGLTDEEAVAALKVGYKALLDKLVAEMDQDDDMIFCSTLTPVSETRGDYEHPGQVNDEFPSWIKEWAADGLPVALNDNYAALKGKDGVLCSDGLHLSNAGDALVAAQYAKSILNYYNSDGTEKNIQEKITAAQEDGLDEFYLNSDEKIEKLANIPAEFTLDLNGHTLTAEFVNAFGDIKDSSGGEGIIKIAQNQTNDNKLIVQQNNAMLPLYDTEDSGYRFFAFELINKGQKQGTSTDPNDLNAKRYGVHLSFESKMAYELMAAGALDVDLYMHLTTENEKLGKGGFNYRFNQNTLINYGKQCLDVYNDSDALAKKTIVLIVTGMEKLDEDLQVTARLETTTDIIPSVVVAK